MRSPSISFAPYGRPFHNSYAIFPVQCISIFTFALRLFLHLIGYCMKIEDDCGGHSSNVYLYPWSDRWNVLGRMDPSRRNMWLSRRLFANEDPGPDDLQWHCAFSIRPRLYQLQARNMANALLSWSMALSGQRIFLVPVPRWYLESHHQHSKLGT